MGTTLKLVPYALLLALTCGADEAPAPEGFMKLLQATADVSDFGGGDYEDEDAGSRFSQSTMMADGKVQFGFQCQNLPISLRVEWGDVDVRAISLRVEDDPGILGTVANAVAAGLGGNTEGDDDDFQEEDDTKARYGEEDLLVGNISLAAFEYPANASENSPLKPSYLVSATTISNMDETTMTLAPLQPGDIKIKYECSQAGQAIVQLKYTVTRGIENPEVKEVCMQWRKVCTLSWTPLWVYHKGSPIVEDGAMVSNSELKLEGAKAEEGATQFEFSSEGYLQLKIDQAVSDKPFLKVDVRTSDMDGVLEVSARDPGQASVIYECTAKGEATVTMDVRRIAMARASANPEPTFRLTWKKKCGALNSGINEALQVNIMSETYLNSTTAVSKGLALTGYLRPCRGATMTSCANQRQYLMIPKTDKRTKIELVTHGEVIPDLNPAPDVIYDHNIMSVQVASSHYKTGTPESRSIFVKYICFKEGISVVTLTIHMLMHKPVDFAYLKYCAKPRVHVSKAVTAPQVMNWVMISICVVGVAIIAGFSVLRKAVCSMMGSSPSSSSTVQPGASGDVESAPAKTAQKSTKSTRPQVEDPEAVEKSGEVTYHA